MNRTHSIELLNAAVADELQAVHQYLYFHFHLSDQGLEPLAKLFKVTAIQEMGHVEALAERILFLKGDVVMASMGPVELIVEPEQILEKAMQMEEGSAKFYNEAAAKCGANQDAATKQLFERHVADEERHLDQYERQRDNIRRFGLSYLALQSFGDAAPAAHPGAAE
jgi:bacterioferritin